MQMPGGWAQPRLRPRNDTYQLIRAVLIVRLLQVFLIGVLAFLALIVVVGCTGCSRRPSRCGGP